MARRDTGARGRPLCTRAQKPACQGTAHKTSQSIPLLRPHSHWVLTAGPDTTCLGPDAYLPGVVLATSPPPRPLTGIPPGLGGLRDPAGIKAPTRIGNVLVTPQPRLQTRLSWQAQQHPMAQSQAEGLGRAGQCSHAVHSLCSHSKRFLQVPRSLCPTVTCPTPFA